MAFDFSSRDKTHRIDNIPIARISALGKDNSHHIFQESLKDQILIYAFILPDNLFLLN